MREPRANRANQNPFSDIQSTSAALARVRLIETIKASQKEKLISNCVLDGERGGGCRLGVAVLWNMSILLSVYDVRYV